MAAAPAAPAHGRSTLTVRTFTEADFELVTLFSVRLLSPTDFELYKASFLGRPVPEQRRSDRELRELGYRSAEPWVQFCLESPIMNWR